MTEFEKEFLELYRQEIKDLRDWREDVLRAVALEVGAKMRSPMTSTSTSQRSNVQSNAEWAYIQATGRKW